MSIDKSVDISPLLTWNHFCSAIKLFFESCCNVVENGQFPPAGAQRARSRQSVTFAFGAHKVLDCLFDIGKWLRLESFFFFSKRAINDCKRLIYLPVFLPRCCAAWPAFWGRCVVGSGRPWIRETFYNRAGHCQRIRPTPSCRQQKRLDTRRKETQKNEILFLETRFSF